MRSSQRQEALDKAHSFMEQEKYREALVEYTYLHDITHDPKEKSDLQRTIKSVKSIINVLEKRQREEQAQLARQKKE